MREPPIISRRRVPGVKSVNGTVVISLGSHRHRHCSLMLLLAQRLNTRVTKPGDGQISRGKHRAKERNGKQGRFSATLVLGSVVTIPNNPEGDREGGGRGFSCDPYAEANAEARQGKAR